MGDPRTNLPNIMFWRIHDIERREAARVEAYSIVGGSPADFVAHLKAEHAKLARLMKEAGIKAN